MKGLAAMAAEAETDDEVIVSEAMPEEGRMLPHEIATDERFNLRRYDPGDEEELRKVKQLAYLMERDGQLDPIILAPLIEENGRLVLLAGHRRRRAATIINEARARDHKPLFRLRYTVNRDGGDLLRKALTSNTAREQLSPMDLALNIRRIRDEQRWEGIGGAKRIAEYLGVSTATVTQHEKFLLPECDEETRQKLHHGVISADTAFDMLHVKPDKRGEVYQKAAVIQKDHDIDKAIAEVGRGKVSAEKVVADLHKKTRIESPAIKEAIRDTPGASDRPQPLSRKEIVEFILQFDSPAYGAQDSAVRVWVTAMGKLFDGTAGPNGERSAVSKFDAMIGKAAKGKALSPKAARSHNERKAVKAVKAALAKSATGTVKKKRSPRHGTRVI